MSVDHEARKLVLSMRTKPRMPVSEQGNVEKYAKILSEVILATNDESNECT